MSNINLLSSNEEINIDDAINYINVIEENIIKVWKKFLISEFSEGMNIITDIFTYIDKVIYYIEKINSNKKIRIDIGEVFTIFAELEKAIKTPDYILIADLMMYEIKPITGMWKKKLELIKN